MTIDWHVYRHLQKGSGMRRTGRLAAWCAAAMIGLLPVCGLAQSSGPLRITIEDGVIEPLPFNDAIFTGLQSAGARI